METILKGYSVNDPTWFYLSLFLIVAIYFRFNRWWSLRNLDLVLLLSTSPGLLLIQRNQPTAGFSWMLTVTGLWMARVCFEPLIRRRPKPEPNLNIQGMTFLLIASFAFLSTRAFQAPLPQGSVAAIQEAQHLMGEEGSVGEAVPTANDGNAADKDTPVVTPGITAPLLTAPVINTSKQLTLESEQSETTLLNSAEVFAVRLLAVLSHLSIITGLILIGRWTFQDPRTGVSMALLYLLIPCTAYVVGELNHILPTAFLLWALLAVRRAWLTGLLLGLACGTMIFPIFTLPIWIRRYESWHRWQFLGTWGGTTLALLLILALTSSDTSLFSQQTLGGVNWGLLSFDDSTHRDGFWTTLHPAYRIPVITAYLVLVAVLTIFVRQSSFKNLLWTQTALIVGVQFWYPIHGGTYILWYLPFVLLIVYRPTLVKADQAEAKSMIRSANEVPSSESTSGSSVSIRSVPARESSAYTVMPTTRSTH